MKAAAAAVASYGLLCVLSIGVAAYAVVSYSLFPLGAAVHPDLRASFESHRIGIYAHVFAAAVALLLGPLQFSQRARIAHLRLHRITGRIYLAAGVLVGGLAGFYVAMFAYGGLVSRTGFALLALAWIYTGARAYQAARKKHFRAHRDWMVRNFSPAFAAVTLRIELALAFAIGMPFEVIYPLLAWLSWAPNLVLAEAVVRKRP